MDAPRLASRPAWFALLVACTAWLAVRPAPADEGAAGRREPGLLERLSSEVAAIADRAQRASATLETEQGPLRGVLVGSPPRLVVPLAQASDGSTPSLPEKADVRLADGTGRSAERRFADRDLGLAVYDLDMAAGPLVGLEPATAPTVDQGGLAVLVDGTQGLLPLLGARRPALEDVALQGVGGSLLCAADGTLLGIAPQAGAGSCSACHMAQPAVSGDGLRRLFYSDQPWRIDVRAGATAFPGCRCEGAHAMAPENGTRAFVPATVLARAMEDLASGRSPANAYLGVVLEPGAAWLVATRGVEPGAAGGWLLADVATQWRALGPHGGASSWPQWAGKHFLLHHAVSHARNGARLASVVAESPADKAGLAAGNVLAAIDGVPLRDVPHALRLLARRRPGETVRIVVLGKEAPIEVVLGDRARDAVELPTARSVGLTVQPMTAELATWLGRASGAGGLVVREVAPGSAAAQAGLGRGEVLRKAEGAELRDEDEFDAVLGSARGDVLLEVERADGRVASLHLRVAPVVPRKSR